MIDYRIKKKKSSPNDETRSISKTPRTGYCDQKEKKNQVRRELLVAGFSLLPRLTSIVAMTSTCSRKLTSSPVPRQPLLFHWMWLGWSKANVSFLWKKLCWNLRYALRKPSSNSSQGILDGQLLDADVFRGNGGPAGGGLDEPAGVHQTETEAKIEAQSGAVALPAFGTNQRLRIARPGCYVLHISPRQIGAKKFESSSHPMGCTSNETIREMVLVSYGDDIKIQMSTKMLLGFQCQRDDASGQWSRGRSACMFRRALIL